ncbi:MAG: glycosyl transferase [Rhodobacteraceae bacterium]|nr:glycosyl transferase [Paracoccaceae bacterium]
MTLANIICIKWGTVFGPEYVNRLYSGVRRNIDYPVRFMCMTEHAEGLHPQVEVLPLPSEPYQHDMDAALAVANRQGAMKKVSLFRKGLIPDLQGHVLGFDLDVVITGDLTQIYDMAPGKVCMRHDWTEKRKGRPTGHGSVFRYNPELHGFLYKDIAGNAYSEVEQARGSEQRYTSHKAMERGCFEYIPETQVVSFKYDCNGFPLNYLRAPKLPADARVVCFHGRPKMTDALEGYRGSLLRYSKRCAWLYDHWIARSEADLGGTGHDLS